MTSRDGKKTFALFAIAAVLFGMPIGGALVSWWTVREHRAAAAEVAREIAEEKRASVRRIVSEHCDSECCTAAFSDGSCKTICQNRFGGWSGR